MRGLPSSGHVRRSRPARWRGPVRCRCSTERGSRSSSWTTPVAESAEAALRRALPYRVRMERTAPFPPRSRSSTPAPLGPLLAHLAVDGLDDQVDVGPRSHAPIVHHRWLSKTSRRRRPTPMGRTRLARPARRVRSERICLRPAKPRLGERSLRYRGGVAQNGSTRDHSRSAAWASYSVGSDGSVNRCPAPG